VVQPVQGDLVTCSGDVVDELGMAFRLGDEQEESTTRVTAA
jgi:hypothetical protein